MPVNAPSLVSRRRNSHSYVLLGFALNHRVSQCERYFYISDWRGFINVQVLAISTSKDVTEKLPRPELRVMQHSNFILVRPCLSSNVNISYSTLKLPNIIGINHAINKLFREQAHKSTDRRRDEKKYTVSTKKVTPCIHCHNSDKQYQILTEFWTNNAMSNCKQITKFK